MTITNFDFRIVKDTADSDFARKLKALDHLQVFSASNLAYTALFDRGRVGRTIQGKPVKRTTSHRYMPGGDPELSFFVRVDTNQALLQDGRGEEICNLVGSSKPRPRHWCRRFCFTMIPNRCMTSFSERELQDSTHSPTCRCQYRKSRRL
jgi:hypothetical protein